jgi:hypothetical protein
MEYHVTPFELTDQMPEQEYTSVKSQQQSHNNPEDGQLKLLLCEMLFFTQSLPLADAQKSAKVVYVGAAPGTHMPPLLGQLMQATKWTFDFYDPIDFDRRLKSMAQQFPNRLRLYKQYFTDTDAAKYTNGEVLFISDIRDNDHSKGKQRHVQEDIAQDMAMQQRWVQTIKPVAAYLKFRFPWPEPGGEELSDFSYMRGRIFMQAFAPKNSTETRLFVKGGDVDTSKTYYPKHYDNKMAYVNNVLRPTKDFDYKLAITVCRDFESHFHGCRSVDLLTDTKRCWLELKNRLSERQPKRLAR